MTQLARAILCALVLMISSHQLFAQGFGPVPPSSQSVVTQPSPASPGSARPGSFQPGSLDEFNPLNLLNDAGLLIQGANNMGAGVNPASPSPSSSSNNDRGGVSVAINIMLLLTVIALVPSIMLMTTSFVRIMVVLALLRQAMGTQSLPPAQVVTGLALFMTMLVMKPTVDRIWTDAVVPYQNGEIREMDVLWERASNPMRDFMFDQIEATDNWSSLYMILNYQGIDTSEPESITRADITTTSLIPAYMLSELKVAFLMGFRVYLPFLVIDMVIASLLISMSMMMLPPVMISLPFKLMLFVMVDGWALIVGSLLESFVQEGAGPRASAMTASMVGILPILMVCKVIHPPSHDPNNQADPKLRGVSNDL